MIPIDLPTYKSLDKTVFIPALNYFKYFHRLCKYFLAWLSPSVYTQGVKGSYPLTPLNFISIAKNSVILITIIDLI